MLATSMLQRDVVKPDIAFSNRNQRYRKLVAVPFNASHVLRHDTSRSPDEYVAA